MKRSQNSTGHVADYVVVGGGLAGLTAALMLARNGHRVQVFEKAHALGGRATSRNHDGYIFNQGPHALYAGGAGIKTLAQLGIKVSGRKPNVVAYARHHGKIMALPSTVPDLFRASYLSWSQKWQLIRFLTTIATGPAPKPGQTVQAWIERAIKDPAVRAVAHALARVATYANAPHLQSATAAYRQIRLASTSGVLYLDDGWQSIVDGLRNAVHLAGIRVTTGARVERISRQGQVYLQDGSMLSPSAVIAAVDPGTAAHLLTDLPAGHREAWLPSGPPVRAATLDLALAKLPNPNIIFALGIDGPLYFSVHSATARLAPEGTALVQLARYLEVDAGQDQKHTDTYRRELESFVDDLQPGWRNHVVHQRYLPDMVVAHALYMAGKERFGRSDARVPGHPNVFVAGDWVGETGMLTDAAITSAAQAAQLAQHTVAEPYSIERGQTPATAPAVVQSS